LRISSNIEFIHKTTSFTGLGCTQAPRVSGCFYAVSTLMQEPCPKILFENVIGELENCKAAKKLPDPIPGEALLFLGMRFL
jgi:hypothetical protein